MEERVEHLEGELMKCGESLQILSHHFNILNQFLQIQYGSTFQDFYENETQKDMSQEEGGDTISNYDQQEAYQSGEGEFHPEEFLEEYDDSNISNASLIPASVIKKEKVQDKQGGYLSLENLCGQSSYEHDNTLQSVKLTAGRTNNTQPKALLKTTSVKQQQQPSSSTASRASRPPPPLLKRPLPNSQTNAMKSNGTRISPRAKAVETKSNVSNNGALFQLDPASFKNDMSTGKYALYYKKVNPELIQCKICNKILKRRGKFIQHLRTHTGEKPFKCEFCGATFSRRDNMNVHMTRHHITTNSADGTPNISCQMCNEYFGNQEEFNSHLRIIHGFTFGQQIEEDEYGDYDDQEEYGEAEDDEALATLSMQMD